MRKTCYECVRKHLGSAAVYNYEIFNGYPSYKVYLVGELHHASEECALRNPDLSRIIRAHRIKLQDFPLHNIPYEALSDYIDVCISHEETHGGSIPVPGLPEECMEGLEDNDLNPGDTR